MLENVKNLAARNQKGGSNLTSLIELANKNGYYVVHCVMNPLDYGVPQSRNRFYISGVFVGAEINQLAKEHVAPEWVQKFESVLEEMSIPVKAVPILDASNAALCVFECSMKHMSPNRNAN